MSRTDSRQSPGAALVLLVAGWLAISDWRPAGLDRLRAGVADWAITTGTEVLEAIARTQGVAA